MRGKGKSVSPSAPGFAGAPEASSARPHLEGFASRFLFGMGCLAAFLFLVVLSRSGFFTRLGALLLLSSLGLFLGASACPRRWRPGLMLAAILGAGCVFAANAAVFATALVSDVRDRALRRETGQRLGYRFDDRSRAQLMAEAQSRGGRLMPSVPPQQLLGYAPDGHMRSALRVDGQEVLTLSGVSTIPTMLCNEVGHHVVYESDEHGFRNPAGSWGKPAEVLMVGDSFVHGVCVEDSQTLPGLLRAEGIRTLSAAYSGNGPLLELATVREYAAPMKPQVVVWALYEGNDLDDNLPREAMSPLLRRYLNEPGFRQGLFSRREQLDRVLSQYAVRRLAEVTLQDAQRQIPRYLGLLDLSPTRDFLRQFTDPPRADLPLFERVLAAAHRDIGSWHGELVLLYLPNPARFGQGSGLLYRQAIQRQDGYHEDVRWIARRLGIPFLDALPVLAEAARQRTFIPYPFFGHYPVEGYKAAAQPLIESVRARRSHGGGRLGPSAARAPN